MAPAKSAKKTIKLSELREVINAVFDHIDSQLGVKEVSLTRDYYYYIPEGVRYDMNADPSDLLVGRLADDLNFLNSIFSDKTLATPLNFMHIAPVLGYLATEIDWYP